MNNYFYVVSGVVIILALLENVIPSSTSGKSVKTVISVIGVIVILSPITNVLKGDFNDFSVETNVNYNQYLQDYQNELSEYSIKYLLESEGYALNSVKVEGVYDGAKYMVNKVYLDFENLVINESDEHIDIIEKIKNLFKTRLNIIKAEIVIE